VYSEPSTVIIINSRRIKWAGHLVHMRKLRDSHKVLVGKPEEKGPFGRHRCGWKDNGLP
jgi:hypothetical protein